MSTNRRTVAQAHERLDALEAKLDLILAAVEPKAQAATRKKAAPKRAKKAAPAPKRTAQPKADLGRKGWNRSVCALARSMGQGHTQSIYREVMDAWATVQECREAGMTPAEAIAYLGL
jgi:hypothetical protein